MTAAGSPVTLNLTVNPHPLEFLANCLFYGFLIGGALALLLTLSVVLYAWLDDVRHNRRRF